MKLNKRAVGAQNLTMIIIALIAAGFFIWIVSDKIVPYLTESGGTGACLSSVILRDQSRGFTHISSLECETEFINHESFLKKSKIDKNHEPEIKINKTKVFLADQMSNCWYQFGEGQYEPFHGYKTQEKVGCFVCSKFTIPNKEFYESNDRKIIEKNDFINFLDTYSKPTMDKTYYQFLKKALYNQENPFILGIVEDVKTKKLYSQDERSYVPPGTVLIIDAIKFYFIDEEEKPGYVFFEPVLLEGEEYSVIFWQLTDNYLSQAFDNGLLSNLFSSKSEVEKVDNPTLVMVVPYENVQSLGCDTLQG